MLFERGVAQELFNASNRVTSPQLELLCSSTTQEPSAQRLRLTPAPDNSSTSVTRAERVSTSQTGTKKPRARDYSSVSQEVLDRAQVIFKRKVTGISAFPDKLTERTRAKVA